MADFPQYFRTLSGVVLAEGATDDATASLKAERLLVTVMEHLDAVTEDLPAVVHHGVEIPCLILRDVPGVDPEFHDLLVIFGVANYGAGKYGPIKRPKDGLKYMVLLGCRNTTTRTIFESLMDFDVQDAFRHEIQHYLDVKRYKNRETAAANYDREKVENGDYEEELKSYNTPAEFNAHFHNIAEPLLRVLRYARENGSADAAHLFGKQVPADYRQCLQWLKKSLPTRFKTKFWEFDAGYQRKLHKRLHGLHQAVLKVIRDGETKAYAAQAMTTPMQIAAESAITEAVDYSLDAWGFWITPEGTVIETHDSHGHADALYRHLGQDKPMADGARWGKFGQTVFDTDQYYRDQMTTRKTGWVWLRIANNEASVSLTKPTRRAKAVLLRILRDLKDTHTKFFGDFWTENMRTTDWQDFYRRVQEVETLESGE